jgi:hypothetical protein
MPRFNLFQKVYWGLDNSLVTITKVNTYKTSHNIPVYDFTHQDGVTYRDMENNLFLTNEVFPGAWFRVGQEVYFHSNQRKVKPQWYEIIDIFIDNEISNEVLYKCKDENGNIRNYSHRDLYDYEHTLIRRDIK